MKMKKTFDAVAWMRKRRMEIDKEDEGLSWVEKHKKHTSFSKTIHFGTD